MEQMSVIKERDANLFLGQDALAEVSFVLLGQRL